MTLRLTEKTGETPVRDGLAGFFSTLQRSALGRAAGRVPVGVYAAFGAHASVVFVLAFLSLAVSNVIAPQGTEYYAMAKPVANHRVIRQTEVIQFGQQVSSAWGIRRETAAEFADWILEASERQGIEPELLASLVKTESSFRKHVRSHVGAIGPAQVRPEFWSAFCGTSELDDPEQNIYCGAQVLAHLMERCEGDRVCALRAYNVGPYSKRDGAARRYVSKVDRYLSSLQEAAL